MFNSDALDVVISLIFIYLIYSLLATSIQELIAMKIGLRGYMLRKAIKRMLDDDKPVANSDIVATFYEHPLIKYLSEGKKFFWLIKKQPSYINAETFSKVLIDLLRGNNIRPGDDVRSFIQKGLDEGKIQWANPTQQKACGEAGHENEDTLSAHINAETLLYLRSMWADSQGDLQKFKILLEQWFNAMMERCTGWFKKRTQLMLLIIGMLIAVAFNVDTIGVANKLQNNPELARQAVLQANDFIKAHPTLDADIAANEALIQNYKGDSLQQLKTIRDNLYKQVTDLTANDIAKTSVLGLGWHQGFSSGIANLLRQDGRTLLNIVVGWMLTAIAISLGAPFWFDLLNKVMQLRGALAPKGNSSDTQSATHTKSTKRVG